MENKSAYDLWITSMGVQVFSPRRTLLIKPVSDFKEKVSYGRRRRNKMIQRMKRRKAIFNYFLVLPLLIIGFIVPAGLLVWLAVWTRSAAMGWPIGVVMAFWSILEWEVLTDWFPLSARKIRFVKHKNRRIYES